MAKSNGDGGVRSIARAFEIVSLLANDRDSVTLKELQEATQLPRTTLLRILRTIEDFGMVWVVGQQRFAPGPGLLRWADLANRAWQLPADSMQVLQHLVSETRETASIYVRHGTRRICIAQEESPQALRHVARAGRVVPLWAGAASRILLHGLGDDELQSIALESPTGIAFVSTLKDWQAQAERDRYSITHNERSDGLSVIAVPLESDGRVIAALSLAGPSDRFNANATPAMLAALQSAAPAIMKTGFARFGQVQDTPLRG